MSLASIVKSAASRVVKTYGDAGTLTHVVVGVYDPATGTVGNVPTATACRAVRDASSLQGLGFTFGQGIVQTGDMKVILSGVDPAQGDTLTLSDGDWTVIAVRPSYVGADAVAYECLVRQ